MRLAVRKVLRAGADWVKICTTGGLLSSGLDHPDEAEFTPEEIAVAVAEARRKKKPVMAHAYGGEGLTNALHAGVTSIEHGLRLTEAQAAEMAERGCWLVPTLSVMYELVKNAHNGEYPPATAQKILDIEPIIGDAVQVAKAAGVEIAMGTDHLSQRANPREIHYLHRAGLSPREALLAATSGGAKLCGVSDSYGSFAQGYVADAIVLDADPSDLSVFDADEPAAAVLLAGAVVHRRGDTADLHAAARA